MSIETEAMWEDFDTATRSSPGTNPWAATSGSVTFEPDFDLLRTLLSIPVRHGVSTTTGMPAKALDVWIASELRRAGFDRDAVWPRQRRPRVLPQEIARLLENLPAAQGKELADRLEQGRYRKGVASADARVLGQAYYKQVDVVMSRWATGPEILISTKRMDSSLSNNALNRIEESYGDAHNLRGRHPLAAIGYVLVTTKSAIEGGGSSTQRFLDLIGRLGRDRDGYDASAVIIADWKPTVGGQPVKVELSESSAPELSIADFMKTMITAALDRAPVEDHAHARALLSAADPAAAALDKNAFKPLP